MHIAFYAPMKPHDHPKPSGDRRIAQMLLKALRQSGHEITIASRFRSYDRAGDAQRQDRLAAIGANLARRFERKIRQGQIEKPDLWLTYHNYHKAPDLLGPTVSRALSIPYVVVEGSISARQKSGRWQRGYRDSLVGLEHADRLFAMTERDRKGLIAHGIDPSRVTKLQPFLDCAPYQSINASEARTRWQSRLNMDSNVPWLVSVAMMREDQKWQSYQLAIEALRQMHHRPFQWLIVGEGPQRPGLEELLQTSGLRTRSHLLGQLGETDIASLLTASDLFVWPAIKEALGISLMEAQAAGCAVVAGRTSGTETIVAHGETGLLTQEGDAGAFANAMSTVLADEPLRKEMGRAARQKMHAEHGLARLSAELDACFRELMRGSLGPVSDDVAR